MANIEMHKNIIPSRAPFNPKHITKPIQLTALWMLGLIILESMFLTAAYLIRQPSWLSPVLVIAAIAYIPIFLVCLFLLQTRFRPELQEDQYYSEYLKDKFITLEEQASSARAEFSGHGYLLHRLPNSEPKGTRSLPELTPYFLAEELAFRILEQRYRKPIQRHIRLNINGEKVEFDGIMLGYRGPFYGMASKQGYGGELDKIFEVKYATDRSPTTETVDQFLEAIRLYTARRERKVSATLVIISDLPQIDLSSLVDHFKYQALRIAEESDVVFFTERELFDSIR